jgi:hypothetical protein
MFAGEMRCLRGHMPAAISSAGTIPHSKLMQWLARRIVDRDMLHRIKMWLKVPVEERDSMPTKVATPTSAHLQRGLRSTAQAQRYILL